MVVGYTTGVFDLFHVGHVRVLKNASAMCDRLIVGVTNDDLVLYKNKKPVIPFHERLEIVSACQYVTLAVEQSSMDKMDAFNRYKFNVMFVGDDWYKSEKWKEIDKEMNEAGVRVVFFPYTKTTSSTLINQTLLDIREKSDD
jgi:choline-phosphate cytidylyltransferase/glycerol-3-phosphate cytidylyltransferase